MVKMHAIKLHRFQRVQHRAPIGAAQTNSLMIRQFDLDAVLIKRTQHHYPRTIRDQLCKHRHMLLHAAPPRMRDKQQAGQSRFSECCQCGGYLIGNRFQREPLSFFAQRTSVVSGSSISV